MRRDLVSACSRDLTVGRVLAGRVRAGFSTVSLLVLGVALLPASDLGAQGGAVPPHRIEPSDRVLVEPWEGLKRAGAPAHFLLGVSDRGPDQQPLFLATVLDSVGVAPPLLPGDSVSLFWWEWHRPGYDRSVRASTARVQAVDRVHSQGDFIWGVIIGSGWVFSLRIEGDSPSSGLFAVLRNPHARLRAEETSGPVPDAVASALRMRQDSILQVRREEHARTRSPGPWNTHLESYYEGAAIRHAALQPDEGGQVPDVVGIEGPDGPVWVSSLYALTNPDDKKGMSFSLVRVMDSDGHVLFEEESSPGATMGVVFLGHDSGEGVLFGSTLLFHDGETWKLEPLQDSPWPT